MAYLMVHDGPAAIDWYGQALGATVEDRYDEADGRVGHAMLNINGGAIYLADEFPEVQDRIGIRAPAPWAVRPSRSRWPSTTWTPGWRAQSRPGRR